jgi:hypothetical protein
MDEDRDATLRAFVDASARLTSMPLSEERARATATVMVRIDAFATDLGAFELADDVEIAGFAAP